MESLKEWLAELEADLANPDQPIGHFHDLPFAILWYPPSQEWAMRGEIRRLAVRVQAKTSKEVMTISLAELLWQAIEETVGIKALAEAERASGFGYAHDTVNAILTNAKSRPLPDVIASRMSSLSPERHIVFLTRAAALAPFIYTMSVLLDQLKLHQIRVPTVLFYPGRRGAGPTELVFMDLPDRDALGNYFVPIYPLTS